MQNIALAKAVSGKQGRAALRRRVTIKALIAELALRDMNHWAVADFLNCSCSSARNYMKELLEAGVVRLPPRAGGKFVIDRAPYSLSPEPDAIEHFFDSAGASNLSVQYSTGFNGLLNGQRVHIPSSDLQLAMRGESPRARRDPLVSALFGCAKADSNKNGAESGSLHIDSNIRT